MATNKNQKEKIAASTPKFTPRPTAASVARAARNASNRNIPQTPVQQKQSPSRHSITKTKSSVRSLQKNDSKNSLSSLKTKTSDFRNVHKTDSKSSLNELKNICAAATAAAVVTATATSAATAAATIAAAAAAEVEEIDKFLVPERQAAETYGPDTVTLIIAELTAEVTPKDDVYDINPQRPKTPTLSSGPRSFSSRPNSVKSAQMEVQSSRPQTPASRGPSRPVTPRGPSRPTTPVVQRPSTPLSKPVTPQIRSRPVTPQIQSRPVTPQIPSRPLTHQVPSRPVTPQVPSRPVTPQVPSRPVTPQIPSRPVTPQIRSRPVTPQKPSIVTKTSGIPVPNAARSIKDMKPEKDEDAKSMYVSKRKQFHEMKKELDLKQQAILELYDSLRELGESVGANNTEELVVFSVADWSRDELEQLCRDGGISEGAVDMLQSSLPIDEMMLAEMDAKVLEVPDRFADLCLHAFAARQELIDWLKELVDRNENGGGEHMQKIVEYDNQGLELCEILRDLKSNAEYAVSAVTQLYRRTCRERQALLAVGQALVREVALMREDLQTRNHALEEAKRLLAQGNTPKDLEETRREPEEEKGGKAAKDKLATTEHQLRQARNRIAKMDRQLREAEASIASLTATVKGLEDQSRQREAQLEARARKLRDSVKTGEVISTQLAQQRDALMAEVRDLKDQIELMINQHGSEVQDLKRQIKELNTTLEDQKKLFEEEHELRQSVAKDLDASQTLVEELRSKVTELENTKPNPELPTEREMDLWAELQATKETLRMTEDEMGACKREKVRFLETLTKISESDKAGMPQKLVAELLNKEEIIAKMQSQLRDLTKNIKLHEQKVAQYEQYVRDLQAHARANNTAMDAVDGVTYQDLQQEIMKLRMSMLEVSHRNEQLCEALAARDQQLEQQDKTARAQARVIKVREELINMLKNKETEQARDLIALQQDLERRMRLVDEVNKQIGSKADEIQELFSTLESKQQQIHRLERIVLALEEQQRRSQAQRTRHEEKIAALEHELSNSGQREKKFLFF